VTGDTGASAATTWQPTNVVPMQGLNCRATADPAAPVIARMDPLLQVRVVERAGDWARVVCSNAWEAWIDARRLLSLEDGAAQLLQALATMGQAGQGQPAQPRAAGGPRKLWIGPLALLGAAIAIGGTFLPWFTLGDFSAKAWDFSAQALYFGSSTTDGIKAGVPVLVAALVVWPLVLRRSMPGFVRLAVAVEVIAAAGAAFLQGHRTNPSLSPGIGLYATLVGGLLIGADHLLANRRSFAPRMA
jgi:hypothetical protein